MIDVVNGADKDKTLFFYVSSVFVVGESKSKPKPAAGGQLKARLQLFFRDNIMFHLIACHKGMLVHRRMLLLSTEELAAIPNSKLGLILIRSPTTL